MAGKFGLRLVGVVGSMAILATLTAGGAAAWPPGSTLEQQQSDAANTSTTYDVHTAQTFTAGINGWLVGIEVHVRGVDPAALGAGAAAPNAISSTVVAIQNVSGGVPGGTVLTSKTVTFSATDGWRFVTLPKPIAMVAGTQYALVLGLSSPSAVNAWNGTCTANYAGGDALVYSGGSWMTTLAWSAGTVCVNDFAFRTYSGPGATPPATTSFSESQGQGALPLEFGALLLAALVGLGVVLVTTRRKLVSVR